MSMKFLIVSDTHGRMYNLEEAMEREEFDGMIHCGDVEGMDDHQIQGKRPVLYGHGK